MSALTDEGAHASPHLPQMVEVPKHSLEYETVLYKLHLATRRSDSIANLKVWDIQNPHVAVKFDRASTEKLKLDCLIDDTVWGSHNTVESIRASGVQFPEDGSGMEFFHGALPSGKNDRANGPCTFVMVSVAVGRTAVVPTVVPPVGKVEEAPAKGQAVGASSMSNMDPSTFPAVDKKRYDSVYHETPMNLEKEGHESNFTDGSQYVWSYYLKDQDKVFPKYLLTFDYEGSDITDGKVQLCEMCEAVPAILYCQADDAKLCEKCDTDMHSANKVVARHKRVPLKDFKKKKRRLSLMQRRMGDTLQIFNSKCPLHPKVDVEFYCKACEIPVCVHCKMVGNHSSGEMGTHKLIGIGSAWQQAVDVANEPDKILDQRKKDIDSHLGSLSKALEDVDKNAYEQDLFVRKMAREALTKIAAEAQRKRDNLRSAKLELCRQHQEIVWTEHFLNLQREALLPVEFLSTWKRHKRVRDQLYAYRDETPVVLSEIHPDITVATKELLVLSNDSPALGDITEAAAEANGESFTFPEDEDESGSSNRLSIAPLTNRFATLTREFGNRRTSILKKQNNFGSENSNRSANIVETNKSGTVGKASTVMDQLWMQTLSAKKTTT